MPEGETILDMQPAFAFRPAELSPVAGFRHANCVLLTPALPTCTDGLASAAKSCDAQPRRAVQGMAWEMATARALFC